MSSIRLDNLFRFTPYSMSEKKSPPNKQCERSSVFIKSQPVVSAPIPSNIQESGKGLKRKLLISEPSLDDEDKRVTPKRKRGSITSDSSPDHPNNLQPRTPQPSRITVPLSERQQLAMLMKMNDETKGDSSPKPASPTTPVSTTKRTPIDKKVNKRNDRGETSLHGAAKRGDVKETKRLIKAGADVNVTDYAGWTPLHEACNTGMLQVAKQLVKAGADVKVEGLDNDTPLHDAAVNGHHKLVTLLLKHGANPHQSNSKGKTPIDVAASQEIEQILRQEIHMSISNSDSSSIDDVRSPMSPESTSSFKDEDRPLDSEHGDDLSLRGFGKDNNSGIVGSSRRALIPKSPDNKTGSPRLVFKIKQNPLSDMDIPQKSKDQFKSYRVVTVDTSDQKESISRIGSPMSSVDSDLYDTGFGRLSSLRKDEDSNKPFSSTNPVFETFRDKNTPSSLKERPFSEVGMGTGTQSFSPQVYDEFSEGDDERSQPVSGVSGNREFWDYSHIPQERSNCEPLTTASEVATSSVSQTTSSAVTNTNSHVNVSINSGWSGLNSQKSTFFDSPRDNSNLEKSDTDSRPRWDITPPPKDEDSVLYSEDNSQSSIMRPDEENDGNDSRPSSPKVPPLKIIIPSKDKEKVSLKVTLQKQGGLPYVFKPQGDQSEHPNSAPVESLQTNSPTSRPSISSSAPPVSSSGETLDTIDKDESTCDKVLDSRDPAKSENAENTAKVKEETQQEERRVTRQLRSHTAQLQKEQNKDSQPTGKSGDRTSKTSSKAAGQKPNTDSAADSGSNSSNQRTEENEESSHIHPRKRKLRPKPEPVEAPPNQEPVLPPNPASWYQMPPNPFELFLSIRRQISSRRKNLTAVTPKLPAGYKDYLMVNCTYVLQGNTASTLSVPMLSCPHSVEDPMRDFFIEQENARYKLRLQHLIEREKLVLSAEQEILREHGRAARADMNQSTPLSACTVLREEEVYNFLHLDQPEECEKNVRARYNKRQFISWLQDVSDKYEKIKKFLLYRHRHEAESLNAVQKLDWECKLKDLGLCDHNATPVIDELHLPMVTVSDEFDLLPV